MRIDIYTQSGRRVESYFSAQPSWIIEDTPNSVRIRLGKKTGEHSFFTMDVIEIVGTKLIIIHAEENI